MDKKWEGRLASAWPERETEAFWICIMAAIQQQQQAQPYRYEPTLSTQNAGQQELLFLPSNEAAPSGRIKYEFGMKNED